MAVAAVLPDAIEEWTQEQRDSLLVIAERTLAGYGKYRFSPEFIDRHVDDFVQDALLQAWVSQQDPEAEALRIYNPAGFVSFKVVQLALDKAKGEKVRLDRAASDGVGAEAQGTAPSAVERVSDPVRTDEVAELVEHLQATKLAMSQLPERQRAAFVKCQLEGRSQTEVARELTDTGDQPVTRKAVERLVANARVSLSIAFSKVVSGAFCEEQRKLLELVDSGWATPEQEEQAHTHLEDCSQCAQVRAFERFERDAGLAAITMPGFGLLTHQATSATGVLGHVQHLAGAAAERTRDLAMRVWPFGDGTQAGGAAMGTVTTTKAIVAICLAAGGAGACVKAISEKPHDPKPAASEQRAAESRSEVAVPVSEYVPPSEVEASSLSRTESAQAVRDAARSGLHKARRSAASRSATVAAAPKNEAQQAQQEFGFEGSSPSGAASSGSGTSTASSTASHSTGSSSSSSAPTANQTLAPTSTSTSTSSGGGGGGGSSSSGGGGGGGGSQEFGLP